MTMLKHNYNQMINGGDKKNENRQIQINNKAYASGYDPKATC